MKITRDIRAHHNESIDDAVARVVKEEFGETATAVILLWSGGWNTDEGAVHHGVELDVENVQTDVTGD